jgi:hypothetical protein
MAGAVQQEQHAAAHHVAQRAVGLSPLPGLAELGGSRATALARVRGDQFAYGAEVVAGNRPASVGDKFRHQ